MSEQITRVGIYILLEKLAAGGMAEVYLAKTISSDKLVAIKKVLPHHENTPEYLNLFREEAKVSMNLTNGNIVSFIDCAQENGQLYLVMEFVNGLNLRKLLGDLKFRKTKLSLEHSLFVTSEVAAGLDYAHRSLDCVTNQKLNIIHRDINPHNIMLTFDGCVKIIDFGIAKADSRSDSTKVGTIKGKFSYMSPEQASALPLDSRTDVYALGVVLWELLVGRRLHEGKNDLETLKKIKTTPVPAPREISPEIPIELDRIVMKALERDPEKRYQRASDFKFDIDQYMHLNFQGFRASDFTDYVGSLYAELIKSRIEKLVYFSKKKYDSVVFLPQLNFQKSRLEGSPPPPPVMVGNGINLPEGFEAKMAAKQKENLNFEELKKENPFVGDVKVQTKQKAAQFFTEKNQVAEDKVEKSNWLNVTDYSALGNFKHLALVLIVFYAGFSFYKQTLSGSFNPALGAERSTAAVSESETAPNAAEHVSAKTDDFSKGVYKKLKESAQLAYANISIENGRAKDTKIFVDGKILIEKPPIRSVPVYANRVTTVTAYDPKSNLYDEQKVVIQAGRTMDIRLNLKPYRAP